MTTKKQTPKNETKKAKKTEVKTQPKTEPSKKNSVKRTDTKKKEEDTSAAETHVHNAISQNEITFPDKEQKINNKSDEIAEILQGGHGNNAFEIEENTGKDGSEIKSEKLEENSFFDTSGDEEIIEEISSESPTSNEIEADKIPLNNLITGEFIVNAQDNIGSAAMTWAMATFRKVQYDPDIFKLTLDEKKQLIEQWNNALSSVSIRISNPWIVLLLSTVIIYSGKTMIAITTEKGVPYVPKASKRGRKPGVKNKAKEEGDTKNEG